MPDIDVENQREIKPNFERAPNSLANVLAVDLVDACNLACRSCVRGSRRMPNRRGQMDLPLFEEIAAKAARIGFPSVSLYNWTEPFLCRNLHEYTNAAKERGLLCELSSNLSFRRIPGLVETLANCDILYVSVSGFTQATYRVNHRGGNVEYVKRNLDIIADALQAGAIRTRVIVKYFNFPYSRSEWPEFKKFAEERNLEIGLWRALGEPEKNSPKMHAFWDYVFKGDNPDKPYTPPRGEKAKACFRAISPVALDCRGDMYLCCDLPNCARTFVGNFLEDDFEQLLYRRVSHFLCRACSAFRPVSLPDHYAPWIMRGLCREYGLPQNISPTFGKNDEIMRMLKGRDVYFFGHGLMLRRKILQYQECNPRCILTDMEDHPEMVCGMPVRHVKEVLDENDPLPILIFSGEEAGGIIKGKLKSSYPNHKEIYMA